MEECAKEDLFSLCVDVIVSLQKQAKREGKGDL